MNARELKAAERRYRKSKGRSDEARLARNLAVAQALAQGMTQQEISEATGLSRGRIGQLAMEGGKT